MQIQMRRYSVRQLASPFFMLVRCCSIMCMLSMGLTSCGGAYSNQEQYSTIPTTNNPAVTRHANTWQPGTRY